MSAAATVQAARAAALARMEDTCRVTTTDPDTGKTTVLYAGPCRVKALGGDDAGTDRRQVAADQAVLHLPVEHSTRTAVGQLATILTAQYDPALVGSYIVVAGHATSTASARRLTCRRVTS